MARTGPRTNTSRYVTMPHTEANPPPGIRGGRGTGFNDEERQIAKTLAVHLGSPERARQWLEAANWPRVPSAGVIAKWRKDRSIEIDRALARSLSDELRLKVLGHIDDILGSLADRLKEAVGNKKPNATSVKRLADAYVSLVRVTQPHGGTNIQLFDNRGATVAGGNVVLPFALRSDEDEDDAVIDAEYSEPLLEAPRDDLPLDA